MDRFLILYDVLDLSFGIYIVLFLVQMYKWIREEFHKMDFVLFIHFWWNFEVKFMKYDERLYNCIVCIIELEKIIDFIKYF